MELLIFAHRLEASAFLESDSWTALESGLYRSDKRLLAITGEGLELALFHITKILSHYPQISKVMNFGVAGGLKSSGLEWKQVYPVRTVYRQNTSDDMDFTSFYINQKGSLDLVSAVQRVKDKDTKNYLANFASLVDREAWAYAFACQKYKIDFKSYKLVSDFADEQACTQIKSLAEEFSFTLYRYYQQLESIEENVAEDGLPEGFYFTKNLKHQFLSNLNSLSKKLDLKPSEALDKLELDSIRSQDIPAKAKTKLLIEKIDHALDPEFYDWKQQITQLQNQWSTKEIQLHFGKDYEPSNGSLRIPFCNVNDLKKKIQEIDFDKLRQLMESNENH